MTDKEAQSWIDVSSESLAYFAYCCARCNGKLIDDSEYKLWVDDCKEYFRKKMKRKVITDESECINEFNRNTSI